MKANKIKSSQMSSVTGQYEDITDWGICKIIFKFENNTVYLDNKKKSKYSLSNPVEQKDKLGTMITYDSKDEDLKNCNVIFFFPKFDPGERKYSMIYIVYSDIMLEYEVNRYYPPGQLDNLLDN